RKNSIVNADNTKVNLAIPQETAVNKKGFQEETIDKKEVKLVITEEKKKNVPALMNFVDKPENSIKNNNDLSIGLAQNDKLVHIEVIKQEQTKKETDPVKQANSYTEKVELNPGKILQGNKVKSRERIKNKWRVGIAISAGLSNVKNDLFGLDLNMTKALSYQSGPATASQQIKQPSPNYSAFAYQAGFYLHKKISKKSSFSVGVNYALYQTRIAVGGKIDSLALGLNTNLYAAAGTGNSAAGTKYNYHSQLHYLELPIVFTTQINKGKKIPLQWNAGVIFGRLISSNYLHYDTTARGIYFKDNNLLHKTSVSLQTGFGITFFNNKSMPVTISPHLQFALTDFIKNDLDKKYLLFGGLRFQMLLDNGKKK
ncbi:MAG: outer membrane beta-barrel protein, partial [Sphingobacteriales bacterium]